MDPFETPPDWDEPGYDPPLPPKRKAKKAAKAEPAPLPPKAAALRAAWVAAVNDFRTSRGWELRCYRPGPHWDGGVQPWGAGTRVVKPVWPGLVEKAEAAGVQDPTLLVKALFWSWVSDTTPTPYELTKPAVLERARGYTRGRRAVIARAVRTEEGVFRAAVWAAALSIPDPLRATAFALNDQSRDLSPLFRYALAAIRGLGDVAARWRDAAHAQYSTDPAAYAEFWGHLLPPTLTTPTAQVPTGA